MVSGLGCLSYDAWAVVSGLWCRFYGIGVWARASGLSCYAMASGLWSLGYGV